VPTIAGIVIGLMLVGTLMVPVERLWPGIRGQRLLRRGWKVDLVYWLFTPLVTRTVTRFTVGALLVIAIAVLAPGTTVRSLMQGYGPVGRQPGWLQAIELLLLMDFVGYWTHRWFHGGWRWRFHAIHHSPVELDWLSSVRLHPLNELLTRIAQAAVAVGLGFAPLVLAGAAPLLTLWAIFIHANVNWDLGPLRAVIASPRFHRWHHTSAQAGRDRNFAGLFPVWDILFGTYYMPAHAPIRFGVDDDVPESLIGQLVWPFRRHRRSPASMQGASPLPSSWGTATTGPAHAAGLSPK
jgi:sterol desaturase/sphingolipid hydroxylase (fatty acid hydroxylase superfamily)